MAQTAIVIGAGILGANVAYQLQKSGVEVTILDAGQPNATAHSFGWINASFFLNDDHFQLRKRAITAHRDLTKEIALPINWCGCLCFENQGPDFDRQANELARLGYDYDILDADALAEFVPDFVNPPERTLMFRQEAAAESPALAAKLIDAAIERGARLIRGVDVSSFDAENGRVKGVRTNAGTYNADQVVSAVGTATQRLLATLDVDIPLLQRPGAMITTRPVRTVAEHILVSEIGEIRQLSDGRLMMPTAVSHQSDTSDAIASVDDDAARALGRLQAMFPAVPLVIETVSLANRPVPKDGLPVVGPVLDGLYVVCAHSGITLGALLGQLVAQELGDGPNNDTLSTLAPYRPDRF